ncbi:MULTISPECIES: TonB-dependent receptor domain-containing protein [Sphingobacterium]|uniref:TonB-dependent receptor domain-containing protein n=1 Tax=Sphingobacterium TaxID=28453 RepID=UPI0008A1E18F|nr:MULTISPECIES: TonB-dependent receptor [Sphingobacterium]OFV18023.1 TonB-dependent receptor [Sphingobacterium sp. HMSC13C05]HAL54438.1 TonB-dependent receptor [Sphingobacterium sp.]
MFFYAKSFKSFLFVFFLPVVLFAQTGQIKAILVDSETSKPISSASVALLDAHSNVLVKGGQSVSQGFLLLSDIKPGKYIVRITYVGYETQTIDSIAVLGGKSKDLGRIALKPTGNMLNEVVIEGRAPAMQIGIDRKIFNVGESLVSAGGTATDVLANVPTLQVDQDGSVSLRGSSSVKILIDGRESALAGNDVTSLLQSLPANSIEKVEVITNPSSKYDAEGQTGIINIVLKKNIRTGLNGSINTSAGSYDNYMAGITLNYRDRKFNYFGSYNFNKRNMLGSGKTDNTFFGDSTRNYSESESSRKGNSHTVKAGFDYNMSDRTSLSFSGNLSIRDNKRIEDLSYEFFKQSQMTGTSVRNSTQFEDDLGYELNADFKHQFKREGEELTGNASYGRDKEDGTNDFSQNYTDGRKATSRKNVTSEDGKNINLQLDYVLPFSEVSKFEAGYRSQIRKSFDTQFSRSLDSIGNYVPDYRISNDFDFTSTVHAIYANYQNKLTDKIGYQIGLRGEQFELKSTYFSKDPAAVETESNAKQKFFRLYPTLFLTYDVGENGDKVQFSYSRRVQRARGWQVNPFLNVSDDLNYRQGNPNLKPEDVHSLEMSFAKTFGKVNLISSAYFNHASEVIQPFVYKIEDGRTYSRWENMTSRNLSGFEFISKINATKDFDFTFNLNLIHIQYNANPDYDIKERNDFAYNANLTANYRFTPTFSAQVRGEYNSSRVMAQGQMNAMKGMDLALKKDVFKKKASIMLNVRDVFNSRKMNGVTETSQLISNFEHRWMKRMVTLSLSYRFGSQDLNKSKKKESNTNEMGGGEEY